MSQEEELSRYMILIEQYKEQINQLEYQSSYLQAVLTDYNKAKITLENISSSDDNVESLIPIGGGVYLYANIRDTSKALVDIGAGVTAEKSFDDAIKKIDERIEYIQSNQEKINSMIQQLQNDVAEVSEKAQKIVNEQQKQQ